VLGNGLEDVGFVTMRYPTGKLGHIHVSWADPHKVRECVVVGSDRRIAFNDLDPFERVRVFDRGVKRDLGEEATTFGEILQIREGEIHSPALPATEPLKQLCGHFLHCIRRGERPRTSGRDGRDVVAVMQAVEASLRQDGAPAAVDVRSTRPQRGPLASAVR
jgi:predicted dehydrogenase